MLAAGAIALAPVATAAAEPLDRRSFGGGNTPLELVRPSPQDAPELTAEATALIATRRVVDHVAAADVPAVLEAAAAAGVEVVHEVGAGESLSELAAGYGIPGDDGWRRLFDANPELEDPNLLEAGMRLRVPGPGEELARRELPALPAASAAVSAGGGGVWDRLARCESGGQWHLATGNGYYGGLQFSLRSWQAVGGTGYPHEHSRATQIAMAERLRAVQGWGAWPSCSRKLGLR